MWKTNIESLQDKSSYHGKQMNMQGSVTVGYGFAAGGGFNKSKINADHASVNEQAGIYAGDEGYDINVNKHTDLKGALITSTQKAEADGKNHFSTGSLTHSDIENHSNYSGSSFGVSGSVSANFETPFGENGAAQSTKQATDKDGNLLYTDKNGNTTVNSKGVDGQENTKKLAEGKESLQFSYGMGYGKDSDSQSSTTKSGINTQNIIIKDEAEQLKRTGKTVQEEIAAIKTDITTESAQSQSGKLENRFNKDDVQKELDFQREVTEKFGPNVAEAGSLLANKFGEEAKAKRHEAAIALEEAEKAKAENNNETNRALVKQARDNFETASREAKEWETGGSQRLVIDSALNVISTALAGRPAAEVVASGLSPAVNNQIKKATTDAKGNVNTALNLTAHALWGAVEAYAGNRNVAAGAAGAAGGEVAAHFLASTLYNKSPEKLSEEEKRTVSSLSQVAAGIAGGSLSDSSDGAIIAAKTAKDAVENNYLWQEEQKEFEKKMLECKSKGEDCTSVVNEYLDKSNKRSRELYERCKDGGVRCAGMEEVIDVSTNIARAKYDTSGRLFLGDALQDDDTIKIVNYVNERDLTFLKDSVSATDRMLYQASDITNWPFLLLGARNLLANNSRSAFVSAGIGMGANAGVQYYFNKDVDVVDVVSAGALGKITAGKSYATTVNSNMVGSYYTGKIKGGSDSDSAYDSIVSGVASKVGYRSGNLVENKLDPIFNPVSNKYKWNDLGYGISFQEGVNPLPSRLGNMADSIASEAINKPLSKDEKK